MVLKHSDILISSMDSSMRPSACRVVRASMVGVAQGSGAGLWGSVGRRDSQWGDERGRVVGREWAGGENLCSHRGVVAIEAGRLYRGGPVWQRSGSQVRTRRYF